MNTRLSSWHNSPNCNVATISELLKQARSTLEDSPDAIQDSMRNATRDAEVLLCHVLNCNRTHLYAWPDKTLGTKQAAQFKELVNQRAQGTPVAYLTGVREFWSLAFNVTPDTLIPRPETELLVETVLQQFENTPLEVLDLGTGAGTIAIALAHERPNWHITATDISSAALSIARANADRHQLANLHLLHSHWFENLGNQRFDVIVSNPPYIAAADAHLEQGDVRFEPVTALTSGALGLDDIAHLCTHAAQHLKPGGWFYCEHGFDQKSAVYECFAQHGFNHIIQLDDLAGQPRLTGGCVEPPT